MTHHASIAHLALAVCACSCATPDPSAPAATAAPVAAPTVASTVPRALGPYRMAPVLDDTEPPPDAEGYDGSRIVADGASWLPLVDGGRKSVPFVDVRSRAAGRPEIVFAALLDTGAQISMIPQAIVEDTGAVPVLDDAGQPLVRGMVDALGGTSFAAIVEIPLLVLGSFELERVRAAVPLSRDGEGDASAAPPGDAPPGAWPVIGWPELARVDLLLVADSGVVGLFPAGTAPPLERAQSIDVRVRDDAPFVRAWVRDRPTQLELVLDTGASSTTLPRALGLRADDGLSENVRVLGGRAAVARAHAPRLWLGSDAVALDVRAVDLTSSATGLLGGDALMEHRSLLSAARGRLDLAPAHWGAPRRTRWRGRTCGSTDGAQGSMTTDARPCIEARLVRCPPSRGALDQTCVELAVDPSIRVPLAVDVRLFDERGSLRPRAMTAVFPSGSARTDGLALPALPAHPTRLSIRVRRPSIFEADCRRGAVCWWN